MFNPLKSLFGGPASRKVIPAEALPQIFPGPLQEEASSSSEDSAKKDGEARLPEGSGKNKDMGASGSEKSRNQKNPSPSPEEVNPNVFHSIVVGKKEEDKPHVKDGNPFDGFVKKYGDPKSSSGQRM